MLLLLMLFMLDGQLQSLTKADLCSCLQQSLHHILVTLIDSYMQGCSVVFLSGHIDVGSMTCRWRALKIVAATKAEEQPRDKRIMYQAARCNALHC
jgi:hypothetical protein